MFANFRRAEMKFRLLMASSFLFFAVTAGAADSAGNFNVGGGTGGVKCPNFVAEMEKARSLGIDSPRYVEATQGFTMFILGFQTGYNMMAPATYDIFSGKNGDYDLLAWVENYCRMNSSSRFGDGVVALARHFHPNRQQSYE
jgi:hypothetical protein